MNKVIIFKQSRGCAPCDTLAMVLEHDLEEQADLTVDLLTGFVTDENGRPTTVDGYALAGSYNVMATPVTILVNGDGEVLQDVRGLPKVEVLKDIFSKRG